LCGVTTVRYARQYQQTTAKTYKLDLSVFVGRYKKPPLRSLKSGAFYLDLLKSQIGTYVEAATNTVVKTTATGIGK